MATFVDATLTQEEQGNTGGGNSMSSYGTVYAIQQTSVSLAYCLGKYIFFSEYKIYSFYQYFNYSAPLLGGELAQIFGFSWLMRIVGFFNICYSPILVLLYQNYNPKVNSDICTYNSLAITPSDSNTSFFRYLKGKYNRNEIDNRFHYLSYKNS